MSPPHYRHSQLFHKKKSFKLQPLLCSFQVIVNAKYIKVIKSAYDTKFFISLFERAFKMMKNGVYFIVIALLVAELFKILVYAN